MQKKFINVYVKVFEGKTKEGKKFDYYKLVDKNGKFIDVRFTRTVTNKPTEDSIIKVDVNNISYDKNRLYPCYWIREIESMKSIREVRKEKDKQNDEVINNLDINEDNLPF